MPDKTAIKLPKQQTSIIVWTDVQIFMIVEIVGAPVIEPVPRREKLVL